jgi:hypothetical protein
VVAAKKPAQLKEQSLKMTKKWEKVANNALLFSSHLTKTDVVSKKGNMGCDNQWNEKLVRLPLLPHTILVCA